MFSPRRSVLSQDKGKIGWLFPCQPSPSSNLCSFKSSQVSAESGCGPADTGLLQGLAQTDLLLADVTRHTKASGTMSLAIPFLFALSAHIYNRMKFSFKTSFLETSGCLIFLRASEGGRSWCHSFSPGIWCRNISVMFADSK